MIPEDLEALYASTRADPAGRVAAVATLRAHLVANPHEASTWLVLGMVLSDGGSWEDARKALENAVQLGPEEVFSRLLLARAHEAGGDLDAASRELHAARERVGDEPGTRAIIEHRWGLVAYRLGAYDEAARHLASAARGPLPAREQAQIAYARGLVHEASREPGSLLAAAAAYRDAVAHDPNHADAYRALADALAPMGEHGEALEALAGVLRLQPGDERAARNRDVLARALEDLRGRRLVLGPLAAIEASALATAAKLVRAPNPVDGLVRYEGELATLDVSAPAGAVVRALFFALRDPDEAASREGGEFGVTVLATRGTRHAASYATAASMTFLREALGVPMTEAAALYARLLSGVPSVMAAGVRASFTVRPGPGDGRPGLLAEAVDAYPRVAGRPPRSEAGPPRSEGGPSAPPSSSETKPPRATTT